jgi:Alcohol dehydrogenase, class IV
MKTLSNLLYWRKTKVLTGKDSYKTLASLIKARGKALIVTDSGIIRLGLEKSLVEALNDGGVTFVLYDGTQPNPTTDNVEKAASLYLKNGCKAIIAIGGGSSIDCAKGAAIRIRRKHTRLSSLRGLLKVRRILPPLFIIPTTAGTGSETTVAAVITDSETHEKYAISDVCLIPPYALFDPELLRKLPPALTGSTGMDALCHAVEAYIGGSNTKKTKEDALRAISLIDRNLCRSYQNGDDIKSQSEYAVCFFLCRPCLHQSLCGFGSRNCPCARFPLRYSPRRGKRNSASSCAPSLRKECGKEAF